MSKIRKVLFFNIICVILSLSIALSNIAYAAHPMLRTNSLFDNINRDTDRHRTVHSLNRLCDKHKPLLFLVMFLTLQVGLRDLSIAGVPLDIDSTKNEKRIENAVDMFQDAFSEVKIDKNLDPKEKLEQAIGYLRELAYADKITVDNMRDYMDVEKVNSKTKWIKICREHDQIEGAGGFLGLDKDGRVKMYISSYDSYIISYEETFNHEKIHFIHSIIYGFNNVLFDYQILQKYLMKNNKNEALNFFFKIDEFLRDEYLDRGMPEAFVASEFYAWFWGLYSEGLLEVTDKYKAGSYKRNTLVNLFRNFYQSLDEDTKTEAIRHYVNMGVLKIKIPERSVKSDSEEINDAMECFYAGKYKKFMEIVPYVSEYNTKLPYAEVSAMKLASRIMLGEIKITEDTVKDFCKKYKNDNFLRPYITGEMRWYHYAIAEQFEKWPGFEKIMDLIKKEREHSSLELNKESPNMQLLNDNSQLRESI